MQPPSQKAAYALQLAGIHPWQANEKEIALMEKLIVDFRYIEGAAEEFKIIIKGPNATNV